jgi:phenylacetate-CoA ligase
MTPTTKQGSWERLRAQFQTALLAGIPEHLQRLTWNAEQLRAARQDRLRRLLAHAVTHSPFHRRRLAGVDLDRLEPADLSSLPVMTKADMMAALPEVFTDRRLTRDLVEQALAATDTQPVPSSATTWHWPAAEAPASAAWSSSILSRASPTPCR